MLACGFLGGRCASVPHFAPSRPCAGLASVKCSRVGTGALALFCLGLPVVLFFGREARSSASRCLPATG